MQHRPSKSARQLLGCSALCLTLGGLACGGSSPSSPSPTSPPSSSTPSATATITIGTNGAVSPSTLTIARGGRVTFVNNHSQPHDMSSDPHPEHSQCPEINEAGFLTTGQSRTTGNLNTARTCGFHDHNQPGNTALQGRIIIQ